MLNKLLLVIIIIFSLNGNLFAQADSIPAKPLSQAEYEMHYAKLKKMFLKQLDSEAYIKRSDAADEFYRKCRLEENKFDPYFIIHQTFTIETLMAWLKKNIQKTEFKDFEEVQREFDHLSDLQMVVTMENLDMYEYIGELNEIAPDMFLEVINDVTFNHPGKFRY